MKLKKAAQIKQRHLEAYEQAYADDKGPEIRGKGRIAGATVRWAIRAEWFDGDVTEEAVGELTFKETQKLCDQIDAIYAEITQIDPN